MLQQQQQLHQQMMRHPPGGGPPGGIGLVIALLVPLAILAVLVLGGAAFLFLR
jgi:hypothetical protein